MKTQKSFEAFFPWFLLPLCCLPPQAARRAPASSGAPEAPASGEKVKNQHDVPGQRQR